MEQGCKIVKEKRQMIKQLINVELEYVGVANVFYRLGFVEIFGTGVTRIKQLYAESLIKPDFEVSENTIKIVLPVFGANDDLTEDEKVIYKFLSKTMLKPISEIEPYVPFGKSKTTQLLKAMGEKGVVEVEGKGRGTKYIIKRAGVCNYENALRYSGTSQRKNS